MVLSKKGLKIINCMLRHHPYYYVFEDPPHTSNIQTNEPLKNNNPPPLILSRLAPSILTPYQAYIFLWSSAPIPQPSNPRPPDCFFSFTLSYMYCCTIFTKKIILFLPFFLPEIIFLLHLPPSNISKSNLPPRLFFPFFKFPRFFPPKKN